MNQLMERLRAVSNQIHNESCDPSTLYSSHQTDKKYKLMLKTHWETGVNYLCITKRSDFKKYTGSGVRWKRLLKAHPGLVITCLLFSTDSVEELERACLLYSSLLDVVKNSSFANLIIESGYTGNVEKYNRPKTKEELELYSLNGRIGGNATKTRKHGIFREDLQHLRSEWAMIGQKALEKSGGRKGCATTEWTKQNPEKHKENSSKAGKIGGKITGSMFWWNDGKVNKKGYECPGDGFVRGMLMSKKKAAQVYGGNFAGHNKGKK